jgi:hypothetical protein
VSSPGDTELHWLVKDFNVLYRAAKRFSDACSGTGEDQGKPYEAHQNLKAQLERLAEAFKTTEAERLVSWTRRRDAPEPGVGYCTCAEPGVGYCTCVASPACPAHGTPGAA